MDVVTTGRDPGADVDEARFDTMLAVFMGLLDTETHDFALSLAGSLLTNVMVALNAHAAKDGEVFRYDRYLRNLAEQTSRAIAYHNGETMQ